jgi:phytoene dehydrogenase-like protein
MKGTTYDAAIVGSGPNGLTAAAVMAAAGATVIVLEAQSSLGGGSRSEELTLPGFVHDVCGAIHPMAVASPAFRELDLQAHGVTWASARYPVAHPLDDGTAAVLTRGSRLESLGSDEEAWLRMMQPFVASAGDFFDEVLKPVRVPSHPLLMARFAALGLRSAASLVRRFRGAAARALFAGCAAHGFVPLTQAGSASFGLVLALAGQVLDWPCARGGSRSIVDALVARSRRDGCEFVTRHRVSSMRDLPPSRVVLFDVAPAQLAAIAGEALPRVYRRRLQRYRRGPGVFKMDFALSEVIPWRARPCRDAATVHLGPSFEDIAQAEADVASNRIPDNPYVLVAQQSNFDPTRAPAGRHTGWAYCHVPHGCTADMSQRIVGQIERFAPGFRDTILATHVMSPADIEAHNETMAGGDIGGGANTLGQFIFRPVARWNPYTTPNPRLFLCSSSTPPGGGVHGMCGYWAARSALRRLKRSV